MSNATPCDYLVRRTAPPPLDGGWDHPAWQAAVTVRVAHFRPEGAPDHQPVVEARLLHDDTAFYGQFRVADRFVRCVTRAFNGPVYEDSCVECFLRPRGTGGYFNFEFNCGGALLSSFIEDPTRVPGGFKRFQMLPGLLGAQVGRHTTRPGLTEPELSEPLTWTLAFRIPALVFEPYHGQVAPLGGQIWTGNFYKCGDKTSHPHWASWAPVSRLNFHVPDEFGTLRCEA